MITCISVNQEYDVFASGSTDGNIVIWSMDDFMILNEITLTRPVMHMDISPDSMFLVAACDDNSIHVHAVATGTGVHRLAGHPPNAVITYVRFARDSCRCVLGSGDGKIFVYEVHDARLAHTLSGINVTPLSMTHLTNHVLSCPMFRS